MDLKRLRTFVAVAEHGTVSKAAEVLHITQPALSRQVGALEQDIGFKLFERAGRRLLLTPRGELLLAECRGLLAHAGAFGARAQQLRRGELQVLRIAAPAMTIEALLPDFLPRYAERFPAVRIALIDAEAASHLAMLERGEADLSINVINMLPLDDRRFAHYLLPQFQMLAIFAPDFPIARGGTIEIAALAHHPLLLLDRSYATRNVFDAACHLADIQPNIFVESRAASALLALAAAGHGVALIPSALRTDPAKFRTRVVTHRQKPLLFSLAVIWDKRRTPPRYAEAFSELLAAHLREVHSTAHRRTKSAAAARRAPVRRSRVS